MSRFWSLFCLGLLGLVGCAALSLDATQATEVTAHGAELAHCQAVGRDAPDGGHIAAYKACEHEAGLE